MCVGGCIGLFCRESKIRNLSVSVKECGGVCMYVRVSKRARERARERESVGEREREKEGRKERAKERAKKRAKERAKERDRAREREKERERVRIFGHIFWDIFWTYFLDIFFGGHIFFSKICVYIFTLFRSLSRARSHAPSLFLTPSLSLSHTHTSIVFR